MNDASNMHKNHVTQQQTFADLRAPHSLEQRLEARIQQHKAYLTTPLSPKKLLQALQHEQWEIRSAALTRLGTLGKHAPLALLRQALNDPCNHVRIAALQTLAQVKAYTPEQLLHLGLQDPDWQVREMAVLLHKQPQTPAVITLLQQALSDPAPQVRESAQQILDASRKKERKQSMSIESPSSQQRATSLLVGSGIVGQPEQARKTRYFRLATLAAMLVLVLGTFTAAGFSLGWWAPNFGDPDFYTTVNQQQTVNGVTVKIIKAYADEGRTIIVYEISSNDYGKRYSASQMNLTGSAPQKEASGLGFIQGDKPDQGVGHHYDVQQPFLVPAGTKTLTLDYTIEQMMDISPGALFNTQSGKNPPSIQGPWHFSFTIPFHHEDNPKLPRPMSGGNTQATQP